MILALNYYNNDTSYLYFQSKFIADCIDEIKQELKQDNLAIKANAVSKLNYVSIDYIELFIKMTKV